jgi:hypothetical protein
MKIPKGFPSSTHFQFFSAFLNGEKIPSPWKIVRCWILGGISTHILRKGSRNPGQKWWWFGLGIKISQSQWDGSSMHPRGPRGFFFPLWKMLPSKVATLVEGVGSECMLTFASDWNIVWFILISSWACSQLLFFVFEEPYRLAHHLIFWNIGHSPIEAPLWTHHKIK